MGFMPTLSETPIDELPPDIRRKVASAHKALAAYRKAEEVAAEKQDRFLGILHDLQTTRGANGQPVGTYRQFGFMFDGVPGMSYESIRTRLVDYRKRHGLPQVTPATGPL